MLTMGDVLKQTTEQKGHVEIIRLCYPRRFMILRFEIHLRRMVSFFLLLQWVFVNRIGMGEIWMRCNIHYIVKFSRLYGYYFSAWTGEVYSQ